MTSYALIVRSKGGGRYCSIFATPTCRNRGYFRTPLPVRLAPFDALVSVGVFFTPAINPALYALMQENCGASRLKDRPQTEYTRRRRRATEMAGRDWS